MDIMRVKKGGLFDRKLVSPLIKLFLKRKVGIKPIELSTGIDHSEIEGEKVRVSFEIEGILKAQDYETLKDYIERLK